MFDTKFSILTSLKPDLKIKPILAVQILTIFNQAERSMKADIDFLTYLKQGKFFLKMVRQLALNELSRVYLSGYYNNQTNG